MAEEQNGSGIYLETVLNVPVSQTFTYRLDTTVIPPECAVPGKRAEVRFGNRRMTAYIISVRDSLPAGLQITTDKIIRFLKTALRPDYQDITARKVLVKYLIRDIIVYNDRIIINYYFTEPVRPHKRTESSAKETERAALAAAPLSASYCSNKCEISPPRKPFEESSKGFRIYATIHGERQRYFLPERHDQRS